MKSALREKILGVARTLFMEKGFDAVGMRDIARALGLQPTQVYRLELSKADILAELIIELNQQHIDLLPEMLNSVRGTNALERTSAYLHMLYCADVAVLPIRSVGAAYGWMWSAKYEAAIVAQVWQLLAPLVGWMTDDGLDNIPGRAYGIWSVYYVGFRRAVLHGGGPDDCIQEILPSLEILLRPPALASGQPTASITPNLMSTPVKDTP